MEWLGPSFEVGKLCGPDNEGGPGGKLLVAKWVTEMHNPWEMGGRAEASLSWATSWKM